MEELIMHPIPLNEGDVKKSLFNGIIYAVWSTYDYNDNFEFLHRDGTVYSSAHFKKLHKIFPVIDNVDWSKRGWRESVVAE